MEVSKIIKTGKIYDEQPCNFEKWAIVRSPVELNDSYKLVHELAPSLQLFRKYRDAVHRNCFNETFFEKNMYPSF